MDTNLLSDPHFVKELLVSLQQALCDQFTESDWLEFGYKSGQDDYIVNHPRLLRSLRFNDEDYGACVFRALDRFSSYPSVLEKIILHDKIRPHLENNSQKIAASLGLNHSYVSAVAPRTLSATEVVERALMDADRLLHSNGAVSCIDRLHTALHGYLRHICSTASISVANDASVTTLFKQLKLHHPALQDLGSQGTDISRILNGFSSVVDAINTIRNHASVAHPNEILLDEAEAILVVNVTRTLFHYLSTKMT